MSAASQNGRVAVPPHALEAEEAVLAALFLAGARGIDEAQAVAGNVRSTGLAAADFYRESHALLYDLCIALVDAERPCDVLVVEAELEATGQLEQADGRARLHGLAVLSPATGNAAHYAQVVVEAARRRDEAAAAAQLLAASAGSGIDADPELIGRLKALLSDDTGRPRGAFRAVPFSEIERGQVEWLDPGRVPVGGVTVLFGDPGLGKSQWTCLLAARLSRGELGPPGASLMLTAEDDASRTIRPRLEAAGASLDLVHCVRSSTDGFVLPDHAPELDRLIAQTGARLATVDPISAHLVAGTNSWSDSSVRGALRPLAEIAERHSCAIVVVMHMNKASGTKAIYRAGGSIGFIGAARSALLLDRDPDDPDESSRRRALAHVKSNLSEEAPTLIYEVQPILLPARAGEPESESSRLHLIGESERTSRDLLTFADDDDRSAVDEATDFLRMELGGGPKAAMDVVKAARAEGISEKTLRRAQKQLGIKPQRAGFQGRSYWSLTHGQLPWPTVESENGGQVWGNPHEQTASDSPDAPPESTHGQFQKVAKYGLPEGEQQVIDALEREFMPGGARWVA